MLPPGGGTNNVDPRFLSLFSCFALLFPTQENLEKIYNSILKAHVAVFGAEIAELVPKIGSTTLKLYQAIVEQLPRTPMKFHYIFNLRDLSRIYEGLSRSTADKFPTRESFMRLWRNECERVFMDRLISPEDRELVGKKLIPQIMNEFFADVQEAVLADPLLVGDYLTA
jgi:dynein heavy chain